MRKPSGEKVQEMGSGCFRAWASWDTGSEDRGEECAVINVEVCVWSGEVSEGVVGYGLVCECLSDGKH